MDHLHFQIVVIGVCKEKTVFLATLSMLWMLYLSIRFDDVNNHVKRIRSNSVFSNDNPLSVLPASKCSISWNMRSSSHDNPLIYVVHKKSLYAIVLLINMRCNSVAFNGWFTLVLFSINTGKTIFTATWCLLMKSIKVSASTDDALRHKKDSTYRLTMLL